MMAAMERFKEMSAVKMETSATSAESAMNNALENSAEDIMDSTKPMSKAFADDMYPCMLAMLGSGFGFMTVRGQIWHSRNTKNKLLSPFPHWCSQIPKITK